MQLTMAGKEPSDKSESPTTKKVSSSRKRKFKDAKVAAKVTAKQPTKCDADGFQEVKSRNTSLKRKLKEANMEVEVKDSRPRFPPVKRARFLDGEEEIRKVPVPPHRFAPLKENWLKIFTPVVQHLQLQIRFNLKTKTVELRTSRYTKEESSLQKGADFVRAFTLGFEVDDSLALLRLDDLFIDSFEIQDVKPLKGDHLSRAIGRIAGKGGKTKFTIENVTKTRIVLADSKIHILGSYQNIQIARRAICSLILGSPPSKVYGNLRAIAGRGSERF